MTTVLNVSSHQYASVPHVNDPELGSEVPTNHMYLSSVHKHETRLSSYAVDIVIYIGGFLVTKLQKSLAYVDCKLFLCRTDTDEGSYSFIQRKDNNGLQYPSADVIKICKRAEVEVRILQGRGDIFKKAACSTIVNRCLREVVNSSVFSNLTYHVLVKRP